MPFISAAFNSLSEQDTLITFRPLVQLVNGHTFSLEAKFLETCLTNERIDWKSLILPRAA